MRGSDNLERGEEDVDFSIGARGLRKAAEPTVDGIWDAIGHMVDLFTPSECANYFAAVRYEPDQNESALEPRCNVDGACISGWCVERLMRCSQSSFWQVGNAFGSGV